MVTGTRADGAASSTRSTSPTAISAAGPDGPRGASSPRGQARRAVGDRRRARVARPSRIPRRRALRAALRRGPARARRLGRRPDRAEAARARASRAGRRRGAGRAGRGGERRPRSRCCAAASACRRRATASASGRSGMLVRKGYDLDLAATRARASSATPAADVAGGVRRLRTQAPPRGPADASPPSTPIRRSDRSALEGMGLPASRPESTEPESAARAPTTTSRTWRRSPPGRGDAHTTPYPHGAVNDALRTSSRAASRAALSSARRTCRLRRSPSHGLRRCQTDRDTGPARPRSIPDHLIETDVRQAALGALPAGEGTQWIVVVVRPSWPPRPSCGGLLRRGGPVPPAAQDAAAAQPDSGRTRGERRRLEERARERTRGA